MYKIGSKMKSMKLGHQSLDFENRDLLVCLPIPQGTTKMAATNDQVHGEGPVHILTANILN